MDYEDVMHKHPIPGTILSEWVIPAQGYVGLTMQRGEVLRFVDVEGKQVPDLVCFDANDIEDELNLANSQLMNKRQELRLDDVLYSITLRPLMRIIGYSNELCYTYGSMCSEELNRLRYGAANTINCRDNLAAALASWGIGRRRIPNAFVPFMRVEVEPDGTLEIREPTSEPGDYYDLRAERDIVVGVSNCPQERNPVNGWNPTPMGCIVYDSAPQ